MFSYYYNRLNKFIALIFQIWFPAYFSRGYELHNISPICFNNFSRMAPIMAWMSTPRASRAVGSPTSGWTLSDSNEGEDTITYKILSLWDYLRNQNIGYFVKIFFKICNCNCNIIFRLFSLHYISFFLQQFMYQLKLWSIMNSRPSLFSIIHSSQKSEQAFFTPYQFDYERLDSVRLLLIEGRK